LTTPIGNRSFETSTTQGLGSYSLLGAVTNMQTLVAGCGDGAEVYYLAADDADWEIGTGFVTGTPDTLSRGSILSSSNLNNAVNWGAGTRNIIVAPPAELFNKLIEGRATYHAAGGFANAIEITPFPAIVAYAEGQSFDIKITTVNTGAVTLDVNALGPVSAYPQRGNQMVAGTLPVGAVVRFVYTGAFFVCNVQDYLPIGGTGLITSDGTDSIIDLASGDLLITGGGDVLAEADVGAFSDRSLKDDLQLIDDALMRVRSINGYTFNRTDIGGRRRTGVIAQEVEQVLPEVVSERDGIKWVAYGNMAGLFVEAIKALADRVDELEAKLGSAE